MMTAAASGCSRRSSTDGSPRSRWSEPALPEQNVQDDDQKDQAADTEIHVSLPRIAARRSNECAADSVARFTERLLADSVPRHYPGAASKRENWHDAADRF